MLRTSWNDHDVARAADPLFAAEAELHLALEHPNDLLICVTVRLDMDAGPDAPPYDVERYSHRRWEHRLYSLLALLARVRSSLGVKLRALRPPALHGARPGLARRMGLREPSTLAARG